MCENVLIYIAQEKPCPFPPDRIRDGVVELIKAAILFPPLWLTDSVGGRGKRQEMIKILWFIVSADKRKTVEIFMPLVPFLPDIHQEFVTGRWLIEPTSTSRVASHAGQTDSERTEDYDGRWSSSSQMSHADRFSATKTFLSAPFLRRSLREGVIRPCQQHRQGVLQFTVGLRLIVSR